MNGDSLRRRQGRWAGARDGEQDESASDARREPYPIDRVLDTYLAVEGLSGLRVLDVVTRAWPTIVGEEAAQHSIPRSVNGAELVVAVDTPARATELAFLAPGVCERLADLLGRRLVERVKGQVDGRFRLE